MNAIEEFDDVTGGCLWGCAGDSIFGHATDCQWHKVAALKARADAFEAAKAFLEVHVCDPDITADMQKAWSHYQEKLAALKGEPK